MTNYTAVSATERHRFNAKDERAARDWVINHLDSSQEWTLYPDGFYRDSETGKVQTLEDWTAEGYALNSSELSPVVQDTGGAWLEVAE